MAGHEWGGFLCFCQRCGMSLQDSVEFQISECCGDHAEAEEFLGRLRAERKTLEAGASRFDAFSAGVLHERRRIQQGFNAVAEKWRNA